MADSFYLSWEYTVQKMKALERTAPGFLFLTEWGKTADGREILEIAAGRRDAPFHILIQGAMHGREYMNTALLLMQLEAYVKRGCAGEVCIHLFPMANPDGCTISQRGPEGIRSSRLRRGLWEIYGREGRGLPAPVYFAGWKANGRGVDLNRNFPAGWEHLKKEGPSLQGYQGPAPASEEETQAILRLRKVYPLSLCISYHSSGGLIYWDYGAAGELYKEEKRLAALLSHVTGYPLCSAVKENAAPGGCSDYFVQQCHCPAVTIETGRSPCPLPSWELPRLWEENKGVWDALLRFLPRRFSDCLGG